MPSQLIGYDGTGEGCPLCDDAEVPFASDEAAVAHYVTHSPAELAFALLTRKAVIQHALVRVDEPGGIRTERHMDEIIAEVEDTASRSPGRPPQGGPGPAH
ncbi:hypothetical protein ABTX60_07150 [Streptomyces sp. NPDC126510]|uniref:hypothetical protein n=1 Tax=Streptomyces sp. NPDC126510 TaxID=3155317 RepID=UPI003317D1CD